MALDSVTDWSMYMDIGKNLFFGLLILVGLIKVRKLYSTMGSAIRAAGAGGGGTLDGAPGMVPAVAGAGGEAQAAEPTAEDIIDSFAPQRTTTSEIFAQQAKGKADEVAKVIKTLMIE